MRRPFDGDFKLSQHFGEHPENYTQWKLKGHDGLDYATPKGTSILAPHGGKVLEASFDESGYGFYVKIENDKEGSVLAHLDKIDVQIGFEVKEGDRIGLSGNSGYVLPPPNHTNPNAGAHLHWGYYTKPRVRSNGYDGFVDQEKIVEAYVAGFIFKYKVGDTIEPSVDIPVGESPGNERFEYGKVGPKFPAKIIGMSHISYNISQVHIGGGTGFVDAKKVDEATVYVPQPEAPVMPADPVKIQESYTKEQYNELLKQRDDALKIAKENQDKCTEVNLAYQGFVALGYTKAEQVISLVKDKDATIIDLNKQLKQVLSRNVDLAKMVGDKDKEDATAIDEGIKAMQSEQDLKDDIHQISKVIGTKPNVFDIVKRLIDLKDYAEKFFSIKREEDKKGKRSKKKVKKDSDGQSLLNWLGL